MAPHRTSWTSILLLISHLCLSLQSGVFLSDLPTTALYTHLVFPTHATCPAHIMKYWIGWFLIGVSQRPKNHQKQATKWQISKICNPLIIKLHVSKGVKCFADCLAQNEQDWNKFTDTTIQCKNIHYCGHKHLTLDLTASQMNPLYALRLSSVPQILMLASHPICV